MVDVYSSEQICSYIHAMDTVASQWIDAFSNEPQLQAAYFWNLFTQLYSKTYGERKCVYIKDAEKLVEQISASQARRAINIAEERGFVDFKTVQGSRSKQVVMTDRTLTIIEDVCSTAMRAFGIASTGGNSKGFSAKEICRYIEAMKKASEIWINKFSDEEDVPAAHCWQLCSTIYVKSRGGHRSVPLKDAEKFIPQLSALHTRRIIHKALDKGYLSSSPQPGSKQSYIELSDTAKDTIDTMCTHAMNGFAEEFGVRFTPSDQCA